MNWIEEYDYETAPYCGHHYNGHDGKLTKSSYREGDGGCELNTKNVLFKIYHHTEEGWQWSLPTIKSELVFIGMSNTTLYGFKGVLTAIQKRRKIRVAEANSKNGIKLLKCIKFSIC